jgi:predicted enzyme related to lactoylglutathione lyase
MQNALNWFEIPVVDLERAMEFYSIVLEHKMEPMDMSPGYKAAFFPYQGGVSGALVKGEGYVPSQEGAVIYLNGGTDLAPALERVTQAGGR